MAKSADRQGDDTIMESHSFTLYLTDLAEQSGWDMTPQGRADKLLEEYAELNYALRHGTKEQQDDESIDVLVCAWSNCISRGIVNPFFSAYLKLERNKLRDGKG